MPDRGFFFFEDNSMKQGLIAAAILALYSAGATAGGADVWITNVKLVSPERLERVEQGSILIRQGRIAAVRRGGSMKPPAGARRIDGKGYYLTPGLIDSHVHLHGVPGMNVDQPKTMAALAGAYYRQMPRSYLYFGYTTVIDLALADRKIVADFNAAPLHPDLVHCGEPLVFANGYPMSYFAPALRFEAFRNFIYDPAQAAVIPSQYKPHDYTVAAGVARVKADAGICVKTHWERGFGNQRNLPVMSAAMYGEVRRAASDHKLVLVTHANGYEGQRLAVDGGVDVLAHGMWKWHQPSKAGELPSEVRALLDAIAEKRVGYQATMQVLHGLRANFDPAYLNQPGVRKVAPASLLAWFATDQGKWFRDELAEGESDAVVLAGFDQNLRKFELVVAYLASKDANFLLGTDTPSSPTYGNLPGLNGYLEMQRLHEAGLSLTQVFKAATINNARAFKLDREVGSIEVGKRANLLLMKLSPLANIAAYDSIEQVWVGGTQVMRDAVAAQ